ncbi:pyridoxamine 5'-phosphate oxidase family protein [Streptomyces sp. DSM 44915]|uniref:Pyridoxamine 5'-phosphate oxidase family protein n=1 Tax=Streptomyces chisholmiae TaxID=3075540 RepID=A0ABU2K1C8_9ACTN|nr:pyridoxamine 5'-phosphate oxidase family protein [Streptomyces sp. DSM 44915]MDT0270816.1 pyridoxamine 5'-phosphate oxidase family protein [Streptomyces sp. DSM 44915]
MTEPTGTLHTGFSEPGAAATPWAAAVALLESAEIYWLSTVRPDGRPHVTPLLAIWRDDRAYVTTGATERKARNLAENPAVVLTTGTNRLSAGLDITVEGTARRVTDQPLLGRLATDYATKYGQDWAFQPGDGVLEHAEGGAALLFEITPDRVFGFAKDPYTQTRWDLG